MRPYWQQLMLRSEIYNLIHNSFFFRIRLKFVAIEYEQPPYAMPLCKLLGTSLAARRHIFYTSNPFIRILHEVAI